MWSAVGMVQYTMSSFHPSRADARTVPFGPKQVDLPTPSQLTGHLEAQLAPRMWKGQLTIRQYKLRHDKTSQYNTRHD